MDGERVGERRESRVRREIWEKTPGGVFFDGIII